MNSVQLTGNLTRDPESTFTPNGKQVTKVGIAVQSLRKDAEGNYEVDFFNLVAWESKAKFLQDYCTKGQKIGIAGRIENRRWEDAEGNKHTTFSIIVTEIENLTPRPKETEGEPVKATRPDKTATTVARPTIDEDELDADPFADD